MQPNFDHSLTGGPAERQSVGPHEGQARLAVTVSIQDRSSRRIPVVVLSRLCCLVVTIASASILSETRLLSSPLPWSSSIQKMALRGSFLPQAPQYERKKWLLLSTLLACFVCAPILYPIASLDLFAAFLLPAGLDFVEGSDAFRRCRRGRSEWSSTGNLTRRCSPGLLGKVGLVNVCRCM